MVSFWTAEVAHFCQMGEWSILQVDRVLVTVSELTAHDAPTDHSPYLGNKLFPSLPPLSDSNYNSCLRLYLGQS